MDQGWTVYFPVEKGLRQGCLLSPTLFSLYINDLEEELGGGITTGNRRRVNVLAYADDIVLLADSPTSLQLMINRLHLYCTTWNLKVNLDKSKVVVFRNGGRPAKREKWNINGKPIEVTNHYKYLGVLLTSTLSLNQHIKNQVYCSKIGLNTIWHNLMIRDDVGFKAKEKVFQAVSRSILCYGAQVWGGSMYEEAEKLLRFFIKKSFHLPQYAPSAFLLSELNLSPIFAYTLKLHFNYLVKVLKMPDTRLPKHLALLALEKNVSWFKDLSILCEKYNIEFNLKDERIRMQNSAGLQSVLNSIYKRVMADIKSSCIKSIEESKFSPVYRVLRLNLGYSYLSDPNLSFKDCVWIMKCRGDLLKLKSQEFKNDFSECQLCGGTETEDLYHFLANCPAYKAIRELFLGQPFLSGEEAANWVNGSNWQRLANYIRAAYTYRNFSS